MLWSIWGPLCLFGRGYYRVLYFWLAECLNALSVKGAVNEPSMVQYFWVMVWLCVVMDVLMVDLTF